METSFDPDGAILGKLLYLFSVAAVTNHRNLGGFKRQQLLSGSGGQKAETRSPGLQSRVCRDRLALEGLGEELLCCLFSFTAASTPWLTAALLQSLPPPPGGLLWVRPPSASGKELRVAGT